MLILRGQTTHFVVLYDSSLASGPALADSVLANCEQDMQTLSDLFGGIMPAAASLPFQIELVPGPGGASHPGCLATTITAYCNANTDPLGIPSLVVAEEAEVFMATQGLGFDCGASNGEALSRVAATLLYPTRRWLWSTGNSWLNSPRPDWVTSTEPTDRDFVSIGCGALFLNYLAYQLNFGWRDIIAAAAPTLAGTAANLGVQNAFLDFSALLAQYFPANLTANLHDDDPFPLGRPSLYLRHNLADDGTSQTGPLSTSPDIIVRNNPVAAPQATFSTQASIDSDTESDPAVRDNQANYVYLRVWNRGTDAANATASVYWSPPATLVTPNLWNLIGSAQFADVPSGDVVQVSDPGITWAAADIPGPGHYCFVATVGNDRDPAPAPGDFGTFADFVNYIYTHNNITWRNFNVVPGVHHRVPALGDYVALPFRITGAANEALAFAFETIAALPTGGRLALQVPRWLGRALKSAPGAEEPEEIEDAETDPDSRRRLRIHLSAHGLHRLGEIELKAGTAAASHLLVHVPSALRHHAHDVAIRQLYAGREVGRITWRIVPAR